MSTEDSLAPPRHRLLRVVTHVAEAAVLVAWFLFVLRYQYGVAWLQPYEIRLDLLFLVSVAAVAITRLVERAGAVRARGIVLRLALAATMTALALVAGEYALRFHFRDVASSGNSGDYFAQRRHARPSVRINRLGFREREIPPKSEGRFRIAVIGDSFTFGNGLEEKDRLSNQLQAHLGPQYEIFNFGVPGNGLSDHLRVLDRALAVSPDFVLLQLFFNDFETASMRRPRPYPLLPGSVNRDFRASSAAYTLVEHQWIRLQEVLGITESYPHSLERYLGDPGSPDSVLTSAELRRFFQNAAAAGVGAGAVMFPAVDAMGAYGRGYPFGFLHERVQSACTEEHVRCLDLLPIFSERRDMRIWWVTPFDAHPSAAANRRASAEVLRTFAPFWSLR